MVCFVFLLVRCAPTRARADANASRPQVSWESAGVTSIDRSQPTAVEPAALPVWWLAPRFNIAHVPFSWVDVGIATTLRITDFVRIEGSFDYALATAPTRDWDQRLRAEGVLGVKLWSRDRPTKWRYAMAASRPQSQYGSTKLNYVELEVPSHDAVFLEGGYMAATLGYRRCATSSCVLEEQGELRSQWVQHLRAGARFSRLTWARLNNGDGVRSMLDVAVHALLSQGAMPSGDVVFDAPAFRARTQSNDPAPVGAEAVVRYTPWYYQWVVVELMLGYLPGPNAVEFGLGFSLPFWLYPWEGDRQFDARTKSGAAGN